MNSRRKHARGNREFAALCRQAGFPASCDHGILNSGELPGLSVEVRRTQRLHMEKVMADAVASASKDAIPLVAHRADRQPWRITLDLPGFLRLYSAYLQIHRPCPAPPESEAYPGSDPGSGRPPADDLFP